ncbi:MAG: hypothetical protein RCG15_00145 [Candidatus Rickettsia vulgarisii]
MTKQETDNSKSFYNEKNINNIIKTTIDNYEVFDEDKNISVNTFSLGTTTKELTENLSNTVNDLIDNKRKSALIALLLVMENLPAI